MFAWAVAMAGWLSNLFMRVSFSPISPSGVPLKSLNVCSPTFFFGFLFYWFVCVYLVGTFDITYICMPQKARSNSILYDHMLRLLSVCPITGSQFEIYFFLLFDWLFYNAGHSFGWTIVRFFLYILKQFIEKYGLTKSFELFGDFKRGTLIRCVGHRFFRLYSLHLTSFFNQKIRILSNEKIKTNC